MKSTTRATNRVTRIEPPDATLLATLKGTGQYADCFVIRVPARVSQGDYIEAFYTTRLFKLERVILRWFARAPSTDAEAHELAHGTRITFAAWRVTERLPEEILLTDLRAVTSSWLMAAPCRNDRKATDLHFGSAIRGRRNRKTGANEMGLMYRLLLSFHIGYSRALLSAAAKRVQSTR